MNETELLEEMVLDAVDIAMDAPVAKTYSLRERGVHAAALDMLAKEIIYRIKDRTAN